MQDPIPPKRSLSEISHLFLSSVRDRQTNGAPRPQRTPPPKAPINVDLTPAELAGVMGEPNRALELPPLRRPPVTAVLGAHLNGKQFDRVKQYARHLAARVGRVGLIEVDASEFRVMCFEPSNRPEGTSDSFTAECSEPRAMSEALEEMNWDVDRWLLLVPNPHTSESRALLCEASHWVLLSTCDHDGVVSSYRLLKGLSETPHPRLSLSLLNSPAEAEMGRVFRKLAGVCQQFLQWTLQIEEPVSEAHAVSEHLVLCWRPGRDNPQEEAPQWPIVANFLRGIRTDREVEVPLPGAPVESIREEKPEVVADFVVPAEPAATPQLESEPVMNTLQAESAASIESIQPAPVRIAAQNLSDDVIELPGSDAGGDAILAAVLRHGQSQWIECPVRAPMCPEARLAVSRDRTLVLLAAARPGPAELKPIALAFHWLQENRALIAMACPQFAIDIQQMPQLRLLVDQSDITAAVLQPMLQTGNVTVQAYRKLRWGGRMGLLLEAA